MLVVVNPVPKFALKCIANAVKRLLLDKLGSRRTETPTPFSSLHEVRGRRVCSLFRVELVSNFLKYVLINFELRHGFK